MPLPEESVFSQTLGRDFSGFAIDMLLSPGSLPAGRRIPKSGVKLDSLWYAAHQPSEISLYHVPERPLYSSQIPYHPACKRLVLKREMKLSQLVHFLIRDMKNCRGFR